MGPLFRSVHSFSGISKVLATVSGMLYGLGIRILRYLGIGLILASSRSKALQASDSCYPLSLMVSHEVLSHSIFNGNLYGDGSFESFFMGFSHSEASYIFAREIVEFLLQEAKCCILAMSSGSPVLLMSSCDGWSSAREFPSTCVDESVGLP